MADITDKSPTSILNIMQSFNLDEFMEACNVAIEYDDEAILDFNPNLKSEIEHRNSLAAAATDWHGFGIDRINGELHGSGDSPRSLVAQEKAQEMSKQILSGVRVKINSLKERLVTCKNELMKLKEEFAEIDEAVTNVSSVQTQVTKSFRRYINNLDLLTYQNRVIKYLQEASEQMKLFESYVNADKKVCLLNSHDFGTDVDINTSAKDRQALVLRNGQMPPLLRRHKFVGCSLDTIVKDTSMDDLE